MEPDATELLTRHSAFMDAWRAHPDHDAKYETFLQQLAAEDEAAEDTQVKQLIEEWTPRLKHKLHLVQQI